MPIKERWMRTAVMKKLWLLVFMLCTLPAFGTTWNVVTSCGAAGNGTTDDTAAINTCIGDLLANDTLFFPPGTYKITSALTRISKNNVEVSGAGGTAIIKNFASGNTLTFTVGGSLGTSGSAALTGTANEISQTAPFNCTGLGASSGSYVLFEQGPTGASGNRGEVELLTACSSSSGTVQTMLHDTYSPSSPNEAANVKLLNTPVSGINFHDLTIDGDSHTAGSGLIVQNCVNCTFTNLTIQNFRGLGGSPFNGAALGVVYTYNAAFNNITMTGIGAGGTTSTFQSGFNGQFNGALSVDGMSITSGNGSGSQGLFGFSSAEGENGTFTNITVDATSNGVGRPFKMESCRYCTYNNTIIQNQPSVATGDNGLTLEYFTAKVFFNGGSVTNIGGNTSFGVNLYGDDNGQNEGNVSFDRFYNLTVSLGGSATYAFGVHTDDVNNEIAGGTISGNSGNHVVDTTIGGNSTAVNFLVRSATIKPPGNIGIALAGNNACIINNILNSGFGAGIFVSAGTSVGSGNTLNGNSSNLTSGMCPTNQGAGPAATPSPTSIAFGNQAIGTTSSPTTITITNSFGSFNGTSSFTYVTAFMQSGTTTFAISSNTCTTVAPGANCTISVTATPPATQTYNDTLYIVTSAVGSMIGIPLSVTGTSGSGVATPTCAPGTGTYNNSQTVSCTIQSGATGCYRLDGTAPTAPTAGTCGAGSTTYSGSISITSNAANNLQILGTESGKTNSSVASYTYTFTVAIPVCTPGTGTYSGTQSVTCTDATSGASIYYAIGSTATCSSTLYTGAVSVTPPATLNTIGCLTNYNNSGQGSFVYGLSAPGQQPQTNDVSNTQPLYNINTQWVQGVGPGYWPTNGGGLTLKLSSGTAYCIPDTKMVGYTAGTVALTDNSTNYVFLDPTNHCVPTPSTSFFSGNQFPIAIVVTSGGTIISIQDVRIVPIVQ